MVHSCYGDASALKLEHGITLAGAFDTGIADSVLRNTSPHSSRGLGTVLVDWLGDKAVHLTHKGKLVHIPFMFNARPLSQKHFVYSAEDVEYCISLYHVMRHALEERGLYELVITLSNDRCTPVKHQEQEEGTLTVNNWAVIAVGIQLSARSKERAGSSIASHCSTKSAK